jgi:hypothetical protein
MVSRARVPGGYYTLLYDAPMVRGRAVVICVVSSQTPAANLPQGAVVLIVVGQVLIAFETIRKGSGRSGLLAFLTREVANVLLRNFPTLEAITSIFINPL